MKNKNKGISLYLINLIIYNDLLIYNNIKLYHFLFFFLFPFYLLDIFLDLNPKILLPFGNYG